jgi:acylglycerol lipase
MKEFTLINKRKQKLNIISGKEINNIKGIIIHLHGLGSHFQPIYKSTDEFIERDILFSKFDYKSYGLEFHGHGKSEGLQCYIQSFDDLLDDLEILLNYIENIYKSKLIFIFGESMGCAVALKYCICRENNIKGLIFMAPLFGIDDNLIPNFFIKSILLCLVRLFPQHKLLKNTNSVANVSTNNKKFIEAKEANIFNYHGSHRLCTGKELLYISEWIKNNGHLLKTPILIFHGLEDYITNPKITQKIFDKIESKKKELYLLETAQHCLLIESENYSILPSYIISKSIYWMEEFYDI